MNPVRKSLLAAVHEALALDAAVTAAFPGGLWTGEIPEEQATRFPAAVLDQEGGGWELTSGGKDLEKVRLGVSAFAATGELLEALLNRLQAALADPTLYFTNGDELSYIAPTERAIRAELARAADGTQVYAGDLVFECGIWRN